MRLRILHAGFVSGNDENFSGIIDEFPDKIFMTNASYSFSWRYDANGFEDLSVWLQHRPSD